MRSPSRGESAAATARELDQRAQELQGDRSGGWQDYRRRQRAAAVIRREADRHRARARASGRYPRSEWDPDSPF